MCVYVVRVLLCVSPLVCVFVCECVCLSLCASPFVCVRVLSILALDVGALPPLLGPVRVHHHSLMLCDSITCVPLCMCVLRLCVNIESEASNVGAVCVCVLCVCHALYLLICLPCT